MPMIMIKSTLNREARILSNIYQCEKVCVSVCVCVCVRVYLCMCLCVCISMDSEMAE